MRSSTSSDNGVAVPLLRTLAHQRLEIGDLRLPGGDLERGQMDLVEVEFHVDPLGDQQRVVTGSRIQVVGEDRPHLCRRLQEELVAVELEPVRLVDGGAGLDAQQHVVGLVLRA
jgi:hypothetical protein